MSTNGSKVEVSQTVCSFGYLAVNLPGLLSRSPLSSLCPSIYGVYVQYKWGWPWLLLQEASWESHVTDELGLGPIRAGICLDCV